LRISDLHNNTIDIVKGRGIFAVGSYKINNERNDLPNVLTVFDKNLTVLDEIYFESSNNTFSGIISFKFLSNRYILLHIAEDSKSKIIVYDIYKNKANNNVASFPKVKFLYFKNAVLDKVNNTIYFDFWNSENTTYKFNLSQNSFVTTISKKLIRNTIKPLLINSYMGKK
jgi:hypothetical protein